jgi:hypothetical protein
VRLPAHNQARPKTTKPRALAAAEKQLWQTQNSTGGTCAGDELSRAA